MKCVDVYDKLAEWEEFAQRSDDAYFWHTTHYMEYVEEYLKEDFVANRSFAIVENNKFLAICPLFIEQSGLEYRHKQFSYAGLPIPFPAMDNVLNPAQRQRVLKYYVETLESMAGQEDVAHISIRIPSLARSYLECGTPFANPLLKHGFIDLAYLTHVIDLRRDSNDIWADIRKGHKSDIKRGSRQCDLKVWDRYTLTAEKFLQYQTLHAKDMGEVTRSQRTFDLMESWVRQGYSILVEAEYQDQPAGFSLIELYGTGAYYGSSCKDPDGPDVAASHAIQWETIRWLKEHGFEWYEVGQQHLNPQWFDPASKKQMSIASFKRGFGGTTVPLVTAEYFYSKALLRQTFESRLQKYLGATSPAE